MTKRFLILALLIFSLTCVGQKPEYASALISAEMRENANAVVRLQTIEVIISGRSSIRIKRKRAVTILNELGLSKMQAMESRAVQNIGATIYDSFGKVVRKLRWKDVREVAMSEGSVITDNKATILDYTPVDYPFTIEYESEVSDSNTAFISQWLPIDDYLVSVERSAITVTCDPELGLKFREYNFSGNNIEKQATENSIHFMAENMPAIRHEQYSPQFRKLVPYVFFGLQKFHLEGVDGEASSWENFSSWIYNNLLQGTDELLPATIAKVRLMTEKESDPINKAKIIYQYVQSKTRYVSIQLGIGGWRPMKAKDVDRLGYGDCKALTNYTRVLLDAVGVPSYYCVVYSDSDKKDLDPDFVSMQGDHVILAIPQGEKFVWLECTSQTAPFGFQGDFTDDRLALLIKATDGKLVRTNIYRGKDNSQVSKGRYGISNIGSVNGSLEIKSTGTQYDNRLTLEYKSPVDLKLFYKDYFSINNLTLKKTDVANDKNQIVFTENIAIEADRYADTDNDRLMFPVNVFNQSAGVPQRYRTRKHPFEISRGFYDYDEITIDLPEGYKIEAKPESKKLKDKFGEYSTEYVVLNERQLLYKRALQINEGLYDPAEYENYRKFREQIARSDNSKMVLIKI